jgi:hypothetical protein
MTLTTEEEFAARLRSSVRLDDLHSDAQPEYVLKTSRRAQRRRALRTSAVVLCGVLGLGLAAPALMEEVRRSADVPPATQPEDVEVVVDTTNGTITLPWDRYFLSESEQSEVSRASALAMRACAAERSYDIPVQSSGGDIPYDRRYGIWWMPQVEVFGYDVPTTPAMAAWQAAGGDQGTTTDEQMAILEECNATPDVQQFWPKTQLSISGNIPNFGQQVFESEAGRAVFDEWEECLIGHGLRRDPRGAPWAVTDGERNSGTPPEYGEPLGTDSAVIDAQCKADVDYIGRLAQLQANVQAPYIAAHRGELTAMRATLDESIRRARAYIAEHG